MTSRGEALEAAARALLDVNLAVERGESFLLVSDGGKTGLAAALVKSCQEREIEFRELVLAQESDFEPPEQVRKALLESSAALLATKRSYTHSEASSRARAAGTRLATSPGLSEAQMIAGLNTDYREIARRAKGIAAALGGATAVRVSSEAGTDLRFATVGLVGHAETGIYSSPGAIGNLPAGEASIGYVAGSPQGVVVIDGSYPGLGLLAEPVLLRIENGVAVAAEGQPTSFFEELWGRLGKPSRHLAEFGVGVNPGLSLCGHSLIDEKVAGTVHVGLGNDLNFGGRNGIGYHADGTIQDAIVEVDGRRLELE